MQAMPAVAANLMRWMAALMKINRPVRVVGSNRWMQHTIACAIIGVLQMRPRIHYTESHFARAPGRCGELDAADPRRSGRVRVASPNRREENYKLVFYRAPSTCNWRDKCLKKSIMSAA